METVKAGTKVELPPAVASAFKKAYPNAVINASAKEEENGETVYEIESVDKGMNRDLLYRADGTVLECEEQIKEADLPAPVIAALKTLYPKATVTKAERTTKGALLAVRPRARRRAGGRTVVAGRRQAGPEHIGEEVMNKRGLAGLYRRPCVGRSPRTHRSERRTGRIGC